ncbi:MAG: hypothetical protein ACRYFK_03970 [Janthinobacterium lividum]
MRAKPLLAAALLCAACGKTPDERAKFNALHMLAHERPAIKPDSTSLKVYPFPQAQVRYYTSEVPTFGSGHLVTYALPAGVSAARRAVYVADNDSAFFFLPGRHAAEFARHFGVNSPAAPPDSANRP